MRAQYRAGMQRVVACCDMQDVTGLPIDIGRRCQADLPDLAADAAGVEQGAAEQAPVVHHRGRWQHAVIGVDASQSGQLQLPLAQRQHRSSIDVDAGEQGVRARARQPVVDLDAEPAELRVLVVTQCEHAVVQPGKVRKLCQQLARAAPCVVRWFAITEGAEDEQRLRGGLQLRGSYARKRQYLHSVAGGLQLCRRTPGQLFGQAALAGMHHQPRRSRGMGCCCRNGLPQRTGGALAAAAVQVQQPAGNEELAHAQAAEHHHDAPGHAEEAARVQGEHAGGELAAGTLARVGARVEDRAGGRVELQQVMGAVVMAAPLRGICRHHPYVERLTGLLR